MDVTVDPLVEGLACLSKLYEVQQSGNLCFSVGFQSREKLVVQMHGLAADVQRILHEYKPTVHVRHWCGLLRSPNVGLLISYEYSNSNVSILDKPQPTTSCNALLRSESAMCIGITELSKWGFSEKL